MMQLLNGSIGPDIGKIYRANAISSQLSTTDHQYERDLLDMLAKVPTPLL